VDEGTDKIKRIVQRLRRIRINIIPVKLLEELKPLASSSLYLGKFLQCVLNIPEG
jgi:hypothetical protein